MTADINHEPRKKIPLSSLLLYYAFVPLVFPKTASSQRDNQQCVYCCSVCSIGGTRGVTLSVW